MKLTLLSLILLSSLSTVANATDKWAFSGISPQHDSQRIWMVISEGRIEKIFFKQKELKAEYPEISLIQNSRDFVFPGLINLHSHMQYHVLPLWRNAQGQFNNRFEWRRDPDYRQKVSATMRRFGRDLCDNIKWAELKAIAGGTTAILGGGRTARCGLDFGVMNLDYLNSELETETEIALATDIVSENFVNRIYNPYMREVFERGEDYHTAFDHFLAESRINLWVQEFMNSGAELKEGLDLLFPETMDEEINIFEGEVSDLISNLLISENLDARVYNQSQTQTDIERFLNGTSRSGGSFLTSERSFEDGLRLFSHNANFRFHYSIRGFVHRDQDKRSDFIERSETGHYSYVVHLAEGKAEDHFTSEEFHIAHELGYNREGLVIIHGLGLSDEDLERARDNNISFVWSPVSNQMLYGETLDIPKLQNMGFNLSLSPDWSSTGSKNLLGELKIAKAYFKNRNIGITAKELVDMATMNPARAVNLDHEMGSLDEGKLANFMVVSRHLFNFAAGYKALVNAEEDNIEFVVVNGEPVYGKKKYLDKHGLNNQQKLSESNCAPKRYIVSEESVSDMKNRLSEKLSDENSQTFPDTLFSCEDNYYEYKMRELKREI